MRVLADLEPKKVFSYFEDLCNIPHPSYHEEQISNYLVDFAKSHNLEYHQDELFNVIIIKEATPGYENVDPIIIQGHMDMVAEKVPGCDKDMTKEGLDLAIDGDFIYAKDTSLGGDDGIAVAYALAILDDDSLEHPRLEFLCTVSEEVGMEGASGVDVSPLKGKKLLNIDNEEEGVILASCAGGCAAVVTLPVDRVEAEGEQIRVSLGKFTGGHSGAEIDKGRANANLAMSCILRDMAQVSPFSLVSLAGGKKDNAIPRDCEAVVIVDAKEVDEIVAAAKKSAQGLKKEFETSDPEMEITVTKESVVSQKVLSPEATNTIICLIQALPNGIMRMSQDIEGLVETSLNLGVLALSENEVSLHYAIRSSIGSAKEDLAAQVKFIGESMGAKVDISAQYPAWEYKKDSKLRDDAVLVYEKLFGEAPRVEAIHAGLECGILSGKIAGLDCISLGPDMHDIHTTEEKLSISSSKNMYDFVVELIRCK